MTNLPPGNIDLCFAVNIGANRFTMQIWEAGADRRLTNLVCTVQRSFEFKKGDGKKVKEDVGADTKENIVRYHLKDDDSEVTVIEDSNRVSNLFLNRPTFLTYRFRLSSDKAKSFGFMKPVLEAPIC